jgi:hypothetical protein
VRLRLYRCGAAVAKKRIKLAMVNFANRIGAMRNGRPDWYAVAVALAEISKPELLAEDGAMTTRGPGRPKNENDFLAMEVHRVMWAFDVGAEEACRRIERGDKVPLATRPDKPPRFTFGSPWKGIRCTTLASRYWRWRRAEKERQEKLAVKIL